MFTYFERERERESVSSGGAEREREKPKQAPHYQHRARLGAQTHKPWDHDLGWNQESDTWPTEPPRRPRRCDFKFTTVLPAALVYPYEGKELGNMEKQIMPLKSMPVFSLLKPGLFGMAESEGQL